MRSKRTLCIALAMSVGIAALLERAASAQTAGSFFGFSRNTWGGDSWGSDNSLGTPQACVYSTFKKYVRWHAPAKNHHIAHAHKVHVVPHPVQTANAPAPAVRSELSERLAAMQKVSPGTLSMFLNDATLRSSDAVMTSAGIFIFKGGSGDHTQKDFVSLAYAKPIAHRAELAAIQKVSVQHFELAQLEKPKPGKSFEDTHPATKTFETIEPKAIRRIAGIQSF
jgi:hypothetical protein